MNCIFSAQKLSVPIDGVVLGTSKSGMLQQAAHLTKGVYCHPTPPSALLPHLLGPLALGAAERGALLTAPDVNDVDLRATAFDTHELLNVGFVCSVCLSIFQKGYEQCPTCGTKSMGAPASDDEGDDAMSEDDACR